MRKTRESSSQKMTKSRSVKTLPSREEIALRAYQIFLQRGGAPGNALDDWTRAERELLQKNGKVHRKAAPRSMLLKIA
jgi:hypothetical protein